MKSYKELQNGSDIRGVAIPTSDGPDVNLTTEIAERIAVGFILFLEKRLGRESQNLTISIGRDSRTSGPTLAKAISTALSSFGAIVLDAGLASTPAMFMSTVFPEFNCDGAIMITASHMPPNRNGMKFFTKGGGLEKEDIAEILSYAEAEDLFSRISDSSERATGTKDALSSGIIRSIPLIDRYCQHIRDIITTKLGGDAPLSHMKITVDAGNGAGGFFATKVLAPLGADVSTSQFLEPDGSFPNHIPNPENKEAMAAICNRVMETGTDLGLIFDTDVDRASAVDEKGKEIAHNGIVAMAAALIADEYPGTTVVTDSITSIQLAEFLEKKLGLKHLRFKRGYRNVINKSIELNEAGTDSQLAIETSGHAAFKQNYFLDDGAYLATLIVIEAARLKKEGKDISTVIQDLDEPLEALECRLTFDLKALDDLGYDYKEKGDEILEKLTDVFSTGSVTAVAGANDVGGNRVLTCRLETPNYEGVRVNFTDEDIEGWALLRKSLHDPIMPLNIEAMKKGGAHTIAQAIKALLAEFPYLDTSKL